MEINYFNACKSKLSITQIKSNRSNGVFSHYAEYIHIFC